MTQRQCGIAKHIVSVKHERHEYRKIVPVEESDSFFCDNASFAPDFNLLAEEVGVILVARKVIYKGLLSEAENPEPSCVLFFLPGSDHATPLRSLDY